MDIDAIYAGIVDGSGDAGDLQWTRRKLQLLGLEKTRSPEVDERMGALRVASLLGPETGRAIVERLVRDPDPAVRTWAFNQAVAAREGGLPLLRDVTGGTDEQLALAALDLLTLRVDRTSVQAARRLLDAPSPTIRAAASRLLGHIGGPGVVVQLRPLLSDADPLVRREATEAIERIDGDRPRNEPANWWDDDEPALPTPPPIGSDGAGLVPEAAHTAPMPAPVADAPADAERQLPAPPTRADATPPTPAADAAADVPWDGTWARLPSPLPSEARALTKLLGMVAPADHPAVVAALRDVEASELADLLGRYSAGSDRALGRGLALAMGYLARGAAFSKLRHMVRDPHPTVRAASAQAIGEVGAASAIPLFQALLADPDESVRTAGVRGLSSLCRRIGREDMARDYIGRMGDQPAAVADAVAEALAELGS